MEDLRTYISSLFTVFELVILARLVLSWFQLAPVQPVWRATVQFFYDSTEWFLSFFRRIMPPFGAFDFSPIVALIVLFIVRTLVLRLIS